MRRSVYVFVKMAEQSAATLLFFYTPVFQKSTPTAPGVWSECRWENKLSVYLTANLIECFFRGRSNLNSTNAIISIVY